MSPSPEQPMFDEIQLAHVQQLAEFTSAPGARGPLRVSGPDGLPVPEVENILKWIKDSTDAVVAARDAQCSSPSPDSPDWNTVFFCMVESAAIYLRKEDEVAKAIKAANKGDIARASYHIRKSQEDIDRVADALGCTYIQLCDFSHISPEGDFFDAGRKLQCGAYCGLFVSKDANNPFMGVVYKGTTVTNLREVMTDLRYVPTTLDPPHHDVAWGARIHTGFSQGLFGLYKVGSRDATAWDVMLSQLSKAQDYFGQHCPPGVRHTLHFTGHSLGGAYCTLTYGEFLRRQAEPALMRFRFGDMYSFGAPRVCEAPFATRVREMTPPGGGRYVFRVVGSGDPVTMVPPVTDWGLFPYLHVSGAWEIRGEDFEPRKMGDEESPADVIYLESIEQAKRKASQHEMKTYIARWQALKNLRTVGTGSTPAITSGFGGHN